MLVGDAELIKAFGEFNIDIRDAVDVISKCAAAAATPFLTPRLLCLTRLRARPGVELCHVLDLSADDLALKWEAYALNVPSSDERISVERLDAMKRTIQQQQQRKRAVGAASAPRDRLSLGTTPIHDRKTLSRCAAGRPPSRTRLAAHGHCRLDAGVLSSLGADDIIRPFAADSSAPGAGEVHGDRAWRPHR